MKLFYFRLIGILIGIGCGILLPLSLVRFVYENDLRQRILSTECIGECPPPAWRQYTVWATPMSSTVRHYRPGVYDNTVVYNANGLRFEVVPYEKPEGVFRVMIIGDSFVEGAQVSDAEHFDPLLSAMLADTSIEIISVGIGGWGTANSYLFWRYEGYRYQPDMIIYHCFQNDLADLIPYYYYGESIYNPLLVTLDYHITERGVTPVQVLPATSLGDPQIQRWDATNPMNQLAYQRFESVLRLWRDQAASSGSQLVFAYAPADFESASPDRLLTGIPATATRLKLPTIDLITPYRDAVQANGAQAVYLPHDGHYNAAGHALLAQTLYQWLVNR